MTHGIHIWLCPVHRTPQFLRMKHGDVFARRLRAAWTGAGVMTAHRRRALDAHLRQVRLANIGAHLPGSYSWPVLRVRAEERFAAGDDPRTVIAELREHHRHDTAQPPSVRTMRRWYADARWLAESPRRIVETVRRIWRHHPNVPADYILLPAVITQALPKLPRQSRGP